MDSTLDQFVDVNNENLADRSMALGYKGQDAFKVDAVQEFKNSVEERIEHEMTREEIVREASKESIKSETPRGSVKEEAVREATQGSIKRESTKDSKSFFEQMVDKVSDIIDGDDSSDDGDRRMSVTEEPAVVQEEVQDLGDRGVPLADSHTDDNEERHNEDGTLYQ